MAQAQESCRDEARSRCAVAAVVTVIVLPLLTGCALGTPAVRDASLRPLPDPYDADLPVPAGFRLVDQASEDWSGGPTRYLRHRYRGPADKYRVREFYRTQMPLVRWTQISDGNVHGRITMRFQRGAESCTITIQDRPAGLSLGGGARRSATVDAVIVPLAP